MDRLFLILLSLLLSVPQHSLYAGGTPETAGKQSTWQTARAEFRGKLIQAIAEQAQSSNSGDGAGKSIGKAVLFSAVVPGTGQFYSGSTIKGVAFLLVEAVALTAHFKYNSDGHDIEDIFETLADAKWDEDSYWNWMSQISPFERNNLDSLRAFERRTFSHFLPEKKNQQYYENVGKYNQFIMGWQDFREEVVGSRTFTLGDYQSNQYDGKSLLTSSETRNGYTVLRKDANDDFKRATTFTTIVLLNHVASALDAGLTLRRRNREVRAQLGMQGLRDGDKIVPALALGISW